MVTVVGSITGLISSLNSVCAATSSSRSAGERGAARSLSSANPRCPRSASPSADAVAIAFSGWVSKKTEGLTSQSDDSCSILSTG